VPLALMVSFNGAAIWLGLAALLAVAASLYPALLAARMTVREALAYE